MSLPIGSKLLKGLHILASLFSHNVLILNSLKSGFHLPPTTPKLLSPIFHDLHTPLPNHLLVTISSYLRYSYDSLFIPSLFSSSTICDTTSPGSTHSILTIPLSSPLDRSPHKPESFPRCPPCPHHACLRHPLCMDNSHSYVSGLNFPCVSDSNHQVAPRHCMLSNLTANSNLNAPKQTL